MKRVHVKTNDRDGVRTIGTIVFDGTSLRAENCGPNSFVHEILRRPIFAYGRSISPQQHPELFLHGLSQAYSGSSMWATNVEG